jgi:hypothetical protein
MIQYGERTDQPMAERIEGTIRIVGAGGMVTLEDGFKLSIPDTIVPRARLKPGATIVAEYERRGRRRIATAVEIKG